MSNAIKPAADGLALANRGGVASQRQKRGLEGVLGILFVAQHLPAHPQYQLAMALHQDSEGGLLPLRDEALEQLPIAQILKILRAQKSPDVPEDRGKLCLGHVRFPPRRKPFSL
jgi:hypothetical protein